MPPVVRPSTSQIAVGALRPPGRAADHAEHQVVGETEADASR